MRLTKKLTRPQVYLRQLTIRLDGPTEAKMLKRLKNPVTVHDKSASDMVREALRRYLRND